MILFIGVSVDWERGPVDWGAWETWIGDTGIPWERLRDSPELRV